MPQPSYLLVFLILTII
uniref:Uncharacterized protein n=1 Tax=Arundo donax TaxID=35708 RepID=A0A0A8ZMP1_ARUDO